MQTGELTCDQECAERYYQRVWSTRLPHNAPVDARPWSVAQAQSTDVRQELVDDHAEYVEVGGILVSRYALNMDWPY